MTQAKKTPLSSFGPALIALLREGTKRTYDFPCDTENQAIYIAHRLNRLRRRMREESHPDAEELYRCIVRRNKKILTIGPHDAQLEDKLKALNIPLTAEIEHSPEEPKEGSDPAEDFLASLRKKDD